MTSENNGKINRNPGMDALLALLLNAAVLGVLLLVFRPYFETNDDTALLTLVNGAKITADPHMVISGIWMGRFLMALYGLTNRIPWYTLVQYAMLFLSFTGVSYVLLRRMGRLWGLVLSLLLTGWFGYASYIVIQFSRTTGIAAAGAMFLLFHAAACIFPELAPDTAGDPGTRTGEETGAPKEEHRRFGAEAAACLAAALLLAIPASWLRFTQFLPCAALTSGIGLWMLLRLLASHKEKGKELAVKLFGLILPFAAVFCICLLFRLDDRRSYSQGDVWEDFRRFDLRREELYDYGFPDYPSNLETYKAAGISDAGYTLYRDWNFADPDRFTVEVMDSLIAVKDGKHFGGQVIRDFLKEVPLKLLQKPYIWFLLFALTALLFSGRRRGIQADMGCLAAVLWGVLLFGILYLYLFYQGRYLRSRVDSALVYALILSVLWFVRPAGVRRTWWIVPVLVVCMVFVPGMKQSFRTRAASVRRAEKMHSRRELLEGLAEDGEHLYVMKMGSLVADQCYGPLDTMPEKVISNLLYLGGWAAYTEAFMETMDAYGISNPYRDVIDHENVYLVDNDIELTMTYLRENYAPAARFEKVGKLQKFGIYRIFSS